MTLQQLTPTAQSTSLDAPRATTATPIITTSSAQDRAYRYWVGVGSAVICGICFGIAPGIVSIYLPFYSRMKDCAIHTEQSICLSAPNANCEWVDATCRFGDWRVVDCQTFNGNPSACASAGVSSASTSAMTAGAPGVVPLLTAPAPPLTPRPTYVYATTTTAATPSHTPPLFNWIGDGALRRNAHAAAHHHYDDASSSSGWSSNSGSGGGSAASSSSSLPGSVVEGEGVCAYDYDTQTCAHVAGYDDTRTGLYAAASTALGAVVPLAIDAVRKRHGLPVAFATCAALAFLSNILASWSLFTDAFSVMVAARLVYGGIAYAIMGLCMTYVEVSAPAATAAAGMALNFSVNLTYLLLDAYGVYAPLVSANYLWLLEGLHGFQWIITIAVVMFIPVVANVLKRPPLSSSASIINDDHASLAVVSDLKKRDDNAINNDHHPLFSFKEAPHMLCLSPSCELAMSATITTTASSSGISPAVSRSSATDSPGCIAIPAVPRLIVSPAVDSAPSLPPPHERHVSFALAPPQVVVITPAPSAAPSPLHPASPSSAAAPGEFDDDGAAALSSSELATTDIMNPTIGAEVTSAAEADAADAIVRSGSVVVGAVHEAEIATPTTAAQVVAGEETKQAQPQTLATFSSPQTVEVPATFAAAVELNAKEEAAEVETSFVEDLRSLLTTYRAPFLRGILIASLENGCGIAAVTNFAPILLQSSGFDPMQGNLLCGLAYVIGAALAAPLERRFSVRSRAFGSAFAMAASALVIGLSMLPPIDLGLLTVVGLVAWIAALSAVYAPFYYYASVKLFPSKCQATASATMLMTSAFWTLIESAVFPSVVTALSGGDNGDKRWGRGLTFVVFAGVGTLLSLLLVKTFKTWDEVLADAEAQQRQSAEKPKAHTA